MRCGAVGGGDRGGRRSQRSWRRALARRPKHHSGLEVDVISCIRHAAPTGGWITRGEALICNTDGRGAPRRAPRRRVRKQTLWSQSPPTRRWSLVGGADEHLAARDPAASVSRLVTAQCALDCSLIQWCFGRRARARRDERLNRSTASDRTAPHRTAPAVPRWR